MSEVKCTKVKLVKYVVKCKHVQVKRSHRQKYQLWYGDPGPGIQSAALGSSLLTAYLTHCFDNAGPFDILFFLLL